ncbi:ankyrin repeat domain-containing protein SOWAHA-like [Ischnura elegans]|uniref:ankyrin repeat domain-containing protein SOWAHA-like n=1 Tax=Ischnura elegans TaxID=197161 RepID=UPI001ED88662|nr:ankyrin repeat domain-containing protein SOWAHA-like [Ischnura elegans]
MAAPTEFTLEAVRKFMIEKGGKVTNHELVKHFKVYLTNPDSRVEARTIFKEYVNTLASIKNEEGEKYLILKRKYRPYELLDSVGLASPTSMASNENTPTSPGPSSVPGTPLYHSMEVLDFTSPARQPPPYRPPPPPISPPKSSPLPPPNYSTVPSQSSLLSTLPEGSVVSQMKMPQESSESVKPVPIFESSDNSNKESDPPPPVPPRRRSSDRGRIDNKENLPDSLRKSSIDEQPEDQKPERPVSEVDGEQKISVKERMQKFNRLASESDLLLLQPQAAKKKAADRGVVDQDRGQLISLTAKSKEWLVRAAQGNYQMLAKLASEDSTLPWVKCVGPHRYLVLAPPRRKMTGEDDAVPLE